MIPTSTRLSYANGYLDLGMIKAARDELEQINQDEQHHEAVLAMKTRLHLERKAWKHMEATSKELSQRSPNLAVGWVHWAYALREMNRHQEAKKIALSGLEHHPEEAVLWFNLACYCSLLGEVEDASKHLDKAISLDKDFEKSSVDDPDLNNLWNWIKASEG